MNITKRITTAVKVLSGNTKSALSSILLDPTSYKTGTEFGNDFWMFNAGGNDIDYYFSYSDAQCSLKAYTQCPPVSAIINRKAQCYINGKTCITNTQGKAKGKEATTDVAKKIRRLILQPNPMQSGKQFEAQRYMYQQLFGYAVVLINKPNGFPAYEANNMWLIPNWMLEIKESKQLFFLPGTIPIESIHVKWQGARIPLPLDSVIIIKDFRPSFDSVALPSSRIRSLEMPINNIIGIYESENVIINRRGPLTYISQENHPLGNIAMTDPEKKEIQNQFMQRYGLKFNQSTVILGAAGTKVQPIGFDANQLRLIEMGQENAKAICDGFGYPPHLLGLLDPSFNNQNTAEKGLYQNTIMPEAESDYEQWNQLFETEQYNLLIEKDFSHITVLQQDKKDLATARQTMGQALDREFKNNWITYNRVLELMGEDTVDWGNIYYNQMVATGFQFGSTNSNVTVDPNGNLIMN